MHTREDAALLCARRDPAREGTAPAALSMARGPWPKRGAGRQRGQEPPRVRVGLQTQGPFPRGSDSSRGARPWSLLPCGPPRPPCPVTSCGNREPVYTVLCSGPGTQRSMASSWGEGWGGGSDSELLRLRCTAGCQSGSTGQNGHSHQGGFRICRQRECYSGGVGVWGPRGEIPGERLGWKCPRTEGHASRCDLPGDPRGRRTPGPYPGRSPVFSPLGSDPRGTGTEDGRGRPRPLGLHQAPSSALARDLGPSRTDPTQTDFLQAPCRLTRAFEVST